jgi:hypothetical protein
LYFSWYNNLESGHVQITKVLGFLFLNPTKLVFLISLRISRNFLRHWTELQGNLDKDLYNQALNLAQNTLQRLKSLHGPLAGPSGAGTANDGKPAALPAGQAAGLDHMLT